MAAETRSRNLMLTVEFLLLLTAALITLIDYTIKQDLVKMLRELREHAEPDINPGADSVHAGGMVGNAASVEAASLPVTSANGAKSAAASKRAAKRSTGSGDTSVPDTDRDVGT